MPQNDNDRVLRASVSTTVAETGNAALQQGAGIEPELTVLTGDEALSNGGSAGFVTEGWHRPYAEALIEDDPTKLPTLIAEAERAILTRYLELSVSPVARDEGFDLLSAADALSELKKAIVAFRAE
jgi:hypothetical protein